MRQCSRCVCEPLRLSTVLGLKSRFMLAFSLVHVRASLTQLRLERNRIGPEGAKALAAGVAASASLTKLVVTYAYSEIGEEGEAALREAVKGRDGFSLEM